MVEYTALLEKQQFDIFSFQSTSNSQQQAVAPLKKVRPPSLPLHQLCMLLVTFSAHALEMAKANSRESTISRKYTGAQLVWLEVELPWHQSQHMHFQCLHFGPTIFLREVCTFDYWFSLNTTIHMFVRCATLLKFYCFSSPSSCLIFRFRFLGDTVIGHGSHHIVYRITDGWIRRCW